MKGQVDRIMTLPDELWYVSTPTNERVEFTITYRCSPRKTILLKMYNPIALKEQFVLTDVKM